MRFKAAAERLFEALGGDEWAAEQVRIWLALRNGRN